MLLSVIIPAFNRSSLLPQTLRSVLAQTVKADEIIVVDDGSTDNTSDVALSFGGPVRVLRQANSGPAVARNFGLSEAKGEFIHFLDSDDVPALNKHECQLQTLLSTRADVVMSPWVKGCFDYAEFIPENHVFQQQGLPSGDMVRRLLCDWSIVLQSCLFRRSVLDKSTSVPAELFVGEDQFLFLRLLLKRAIVVHCPDTVLLYRADNDDKLSASFLGEYRRRLHWARFLILARNECLKHMIEPVEWLGYRQRVWNAYHDLLEFPPQADSLSIRDELLLILGQCSSSIYPFRRWALQKYGGIQQRLFGCRGSSSLRLAPMTKSQRDLATKAISISYLTNP
jgi:glycosyltransferase involved in cell wall biosynthesis